jgi:hypothetical protein
MTGTSPSSGYKATLGAVLVSLSLLGALGSSLVACAAKAPPPRRVIETDLGSAWIYARYQRLFDVEIGIDGNPAEAHTAVYVDRRARGRGKLLTEDLAVAFVTEYREAQGLAQELHDQLMTLQGTYQVLVEKKGGSFVHALSRGPEVWAFWPSGKFIVKVGAPAGKVPFRLLNAYLDRYPSDLGSDGLARRNALSAGTGKWVKKDDPGRRRTPRLQPGPGLAGASR